MRKLNLIIPLLVMMTSCVSLVPLDLDSDNLFHLEKEDKSTDIAGLDLMKYNDGVVANFDHEGIGNWWGSSKLVLTKKNQNLVVNAVGVGKEYDRFGYNFVPRVDFSTTNILKVRVRAKGDKSPTLRIDLKDRNGYVTNNQDCRARLILCDEYVNYYFRYEGRFQQSWPFKAAVDPKQIAQLEIFINPGGENFTGQLIIDEIVPVSEVQMWKEIESAEPPCDISANATFDEYIKFSWSNSDKYLLEHSNNALLVKSRGAGTGYESFGVGFTMTSLTQHPIIKVKAKVVGKEAAQLRLDLVDFSGNSTNGDATELTITNDGEYHEYTFDFLDKMYQGWPTAAKVDYRYINEFMIFLNPGGPGFNGELYIDEITIVEQKTTNNWAKPTKYPYGKANTWEVFNPKDMLNTWWSSTDDKIMIHSNILSIEPTSKKVKVGTGIDPVDSYIHKNLQIKLEENFTSEIYLQVMDNRGEVSALKLPSKTQELTLEYDLTKLCATNPKMNPRLITSILLQFDNTNGRSLKIKSISVSK